MVANLMFELPAVTISTHTRSSGALWFSEVIATFGLLLVILGVVRAGAAQVAAFAVGGYIAAAYWFTSSTSFANPAVTIGRSLTNTFAGIAPSSVPAFVVAQIAGALLAVALAALPPSEHPRRRPRHAPRRTVVHPGGLHMPDHALTVDQNLALRSASKRLADEFEGTFGEETIELFLTSSYDQFANRATAVNFLPIMAERFARQRLKALARVEGKATTACRSCLFLCVHNAGRSQMALGWFEHLAGDRAVAWSGGSEPGNEVNPAAIAAMAEVGIDIGREFPKPWTDEIVQAADVVVTMGCGDACPLFPGKRYEDWELDDPAGQSRGRGTTDPRRDRCVRVRELLAEPGRTVHLKLS